MQLEEINSYGKYQPHVLIQGSDCSYELRFSSRGGRAQQVVQKQQRAQWELVWGTGLLLESGLVWTPCKQVPR